MHKFNQVDQNSFRILTATGGATLLAVGIALLLFMLAFAIVLQEDPATDQGVVQGFLIIFTIYVVTSFMAIVTCVAVTLILRYKNLLIESSLLRCLAVSWFTVILLGVLIGTGFQKYILAFSLAFSSVFAVTVFGIVFWKLGIRKTYGS